MRYGTLNINKVSGEIDFRTSTQLGDAPVGSLTAAKLNSLGGNSQTNIHGEKSLSQFSYYSKPALSQNKSTLESNLRSFQTLQ
jgi:hypothetical protein